MVREAHVAQNGIRNTYNERSTEDELETERERKCQQAYHLYLFRRPNTK